MGDSSNASSKISRQGGWPGDPGVLLRKGERPFPLSPVLPLPLLATSAFQLAGESVGLPAGGLTPGIALPHVDFSIPEIPSSGNGGQRGREQRVDNVEGEEVR